MKYHDAQLRSISKTEADAEVLGSIPEPTFEDATDFLDLVTTAGSRLEENARRTLELILEGKGVDEIATELNRTTRSVTRYKVEIGKVLRDLLDDDLNANCVDDGDSEAN